MRFDEGFLARARANLHAFERRGVAIDGRKAAAVAVVLVPDEDGRACFLLTKRAPTLRAHTGQWALPGGRVDLGETPEQAALRELDEEVGLRLPGGSALGLLDDYPTRSGFVITPVVGIVTRPVVFQPDGREIERVIEVPLDKLRDPAIFRTELWERGGEPHPVHFYDVSVEDIIWGATARILKQFLDIVDGREEAA